MISLPPAAAGSGQANRRTGFGIFRTAGTGLRAGARHVGIGATEMRLNGWRDA